MGYEDMILIGFMFDVDAKVVRNVLRAVSLDFMR